MNKHAKGFTIVELLIVIVVIGILAAITIVSYNGITNKARLAAMQSDLTNSQETLEANKVTDGSGTYPLTLAAANFTSSPGNTYAYYPNSATAPTGYCLQTTNGSNVSSVTGSAPQSVNIGCGITNLAPDPSANTGYGYWGGFSNATSSVSATVMTNGGYAGANYWRLNVNGGTGGAGGVYAYNIPVTAGKTYTASMYTRINNPKMFNVCLEWHATNGDQMGAPCGNKQMLSTSWSRLSVTGVAPSGAGSVTVVDYIADGSPSGLTAGDVLDADAVMVNEGSLYGYADGATYGWQWKGTSNASASFGPQY